MAVLSVAAAGGVVVLGALMAGPVQVEAPRWSPAPVTPTPIKLPGAPAAPPPSAQAASPVVAAVIRTILEILLLVGMVALVAAIVWYFVRLIVRRRRLLRRRTGGPAAGGGAAVLLDDAVPAPVVRRGIARALQILDKPGEPSDAVVRAWLGLEETAEDAGAGRAASETPAEYTARIMQRFDADRAAAQALLRLYQDVRFGGRAADAASVARARGCLLRLQESWHESAAEVP